MSNPAEIKVDAEHVVVALREQLAQSQHLCEQALAGAFAWQQRAMAAESQLAEKPKPKVK